jgi:hypothetical protein
MKKSQFGPCGLYCGACGALDCDGCRSGRVDETVTQCLFRQCARKKEVVACCFCAECPCPPLRAFMHDQWPHHWTMEPNLEEMRSQGVEQWLADQERQWVCPACGAEIKWYQQTCPCGRKLDAWTLPPMP